MLNLGTLVFRTILLPNLLPIHLIYIPIAVYKCRYHLPATFYFFNKFNECHIYLKWLFQFHELVLNYKLKHTFVLKGVTVVPISS